MTPEPYRNGLPDEGGGEAPGEDRSLGASATTPFPAVHRAFVELQMVLTPMERVAVLERVYLQGWADAVTFEECVRDLEEDQDLDGSDFPDDKDRPRGRRAATDETPAGKRRGMSFRAARNT